MELILQYIGMGLITILVVISGIGVITFIQNERHRAVIRRRLDEWVDIR